MARFKIYLEYEGTRYSGWQKQKNTKTIQGILLNIAEGIFKDLKVDIQGSGRTDAGVHAICQVAHLDVNTVLAPEIIRIKFNDKLPHDINIINVERIHFKFHARHDALKRSYIYQISRRRTAFGKNLVWWIKDDLDFDKMKSASKKFIGMHDFISFSDNESGEKSTKVMIYEIQMKEEGSLILIRIEGSHFLWKMVRRMVGVLVEIGRGKLNEAAIEEFLNKKTSKPAEYTAPPSGLFLEKVYYQNDNLKEDFSSILKVRNMDNKKRR
jgi:tRNA pseudouridine38-40 synthase